MNVIEAERLAGILTNSERRVAASLYEVYIEQSKESSSNLPSRYPVSHFTFVVGQFAKEKGLHISVAINAIRLLEAAGVIDKTGRGPRGTIFLVNDLPALKFLAEYGG